MKTRLATACLTVFALLCLVPAASAAKQLYTCGMHPQIIREQPGDCPICGMKLQPILGDATGTPGAALQIDGATVQRMNLKTAPVLRGPVRRELRTVGAVAYNEEGLRDITTKYEGWLEQLHVNATWTAVKTGDPLFTMYSPELHGATLNYLAARRAEGDEPGPLSRAAAVRLQLLDVRADELAAIERTGEAPRTRVFPSPVDGVVIEKMAVAGQMMKPGERIYRLADLSTVWVIAQFYEGDLAFVHEGQTVTVRTAYGTPREFTGTIARLLPQVDEQTRAVAARIVLKNPDGFLRPGMYTEVHLAAQVADSAVLVPEMAVLRSGERNTVFVAQDGGRFEPREVQLGVRSEGGNYEVLAGLAAGERIVTSGQFMLDSESQLREAILKMTQGDATAAPAGPERVAPTAPISEHTHRAPTAETAAPGPTLYTCPMEVHAAVVTDHAGECPKCGMELVPTSTVGHGKRSEELWRQQHGAAPAPTPTPALPHHH